MHLQHALAPLALCAASAEALPKFLAGRQLPSLSLDYNTTTFSPTGSGFTYRTTLNYSCDPLTFSYAGSRPPLTLTAHRANDSSLLTVIGSFYATSGNVTWSPTLPEGEVYFVRLEDAEGMTSETDSSLVVVPQDGIPECQCGLPPALLLSPLLSLINSPLRRAYYGSTGGSSGLSSAAAGLIIFFTVLAVPILVALVWLLARLYRLIRRCCCPAAHARRLARLAAQGVAHTKGYERTDTTTTTRSSSGSMDEKMSMGPQPGTQQPPNLPPRPQAQPQAQGQGPSQAPGQAQSQPLAEARARHGTDAGERRLSRVAVEPPRRQSLGPAELHKLELHVDELQRALRAAAALAEGEGDGHGEGQSAGRRTLPEYEEAGEDVVDWDAKSEKWR